MKIDLRSIQVNWVTIEKSKERHAGIGSMFNELGFEKTKQFNGPITPQYFEGVAATHIMCLENNNVPLIVMEDDARVTSDYQPIIEVPDGCDALYLGTSIFGMLQGKSTPGGAISSVYSQDYIRVYNMLSIHAVLYLSERYKEETINQLNRCKSVPRACDECIGEVMKNFNVLAVRKPFFYQNDGHSEHATLTALNPLF